MRNFFIDEKMDFIFAGRLIAAWKESEADAGLHDRYSIVRQSVIAGTLLCVAAAAIHKSGM
jgi:hypothetical protein